MSGMEGLGREFNIVPAAATSKIALRYGSGLTFICTGANAETFTIAECKDAAATGAQTLTRVTHYYTMATTAGANTWVRSPLTGESAASGVITTTTAAPVAAFFIGADALSDGYAYLRITPSASGTVIAVNHDLVVARKPSNLPALGV